MPTSTLSSPQKDYTVSTIGDHNPDRDYKFWKPFGVGIVWSNPHVSDDVMIAHATVRSNDAIILKIAQRFGWPRVLEGVLSVIDPSEPLAPERHILFIKQRFQRLYNHAHPTSPISL